MGRGDLGAQEIRKWNTGKVLFKPRHVKSKDKLFTKYKKPKNPKRQNCSKNVKIGLKPAILTKSTIDNSNQCLQSNGYLIFIREHRIIRIDLKTMKTKHKDFFDTISHSPARIGMCVIPNQKYFCIDFSNNLIFTFNKSLKILESKAIEPKRDGNIIYLDGLIYLFGVIYNAYNEMETYDLDKGKWKKAASLNPLGVSSYKILATFEGKIIVGPYSHGSLNAYDPFSNSFSNILELELYGGITLLVVNDKLYCIQSGGYIFESLPRDCTQWVCIGSNSIVKRVYGLPLYSLYKNSIYFIGLPFYVCLFEFNLKTRNITFVDTIF